MVLKLNDATAAVAINNALSFETQNIMVIKESLMFVINFIYYQYLVFNVHSAVFTNLC